jgi:two-component system, OmpR family, response regulator
MGSAFGVNGYAASRRAVFPRDAYFRGDGTGDGIMDAFRILVVDDEVDFVETLIKRLRDKGLEAEGVLSGREALDLLREKDFDVCILDVRMPGMDGIETLREMKKRKPAMEVIMLTGHGSVESGIQGLQLGAYNYVMKPVPFSDLLKQAAQAYERKVIEAERTTKAQKNP